MPATPKIDPKRKSHFSRTQETKFDKLKKAQ